MPDQIHCPSCNAGLRVPDTLLGKTVRCPKCKTAFTAAAEAPPEPEPESEPEGIVAEPTPAARRRPRRPEPDEEEDEPEEEEAEDRPKRRRRRSVSRGRGRTFAEAEAALTAPAICLMVLGGFDVLLVIVDMAMRLLHVSLFAAGAQGQAQGGEAEMAVQMVVGVISSIIGLCFAGMIIFGAIKMKQVDNYGLAMTASILALLPCWNCCLIGLPIGIWALVVLNRPEVKAAFP